jgi:hypothetical protein
MNKGTHIVPEQEREIKKSQLAVAIANGGSAREWARAQGVPTSTAYKWAKEREVRREVEACRRRSIDQAVDLLAKLTPWAAVQIAELAESAENEVVRLRALKAIFSDMMAASKYTGLEERLGQLEDLLCVKQQRSDSQVSDLGA